MIVLAHSTLVAEHRQVARSYRVADSRSHNRTHRVADTLADIYSHRDRHAIPHGHDCYTDYPAHGRCHVQRAPTI